MKQSAYRWRLVFAGEDGELHEDESLLALGSSGLDSVTLGRMIPLPEGATISLVPGSRAVGRTTDGRTVPHQDAAARTVAALLPTGFVRLLTPAYVKDEHFGHMPLFGYTAVASLHGKLFASALPLDPGGAWDPAQHNTADLTTLVRNRVNAEPDNRLLAHHAYCATEYGCYTAQNLFYGRDEMAIAVSVACNASCVGCISEQLGDLTSPHDRIAFTPTLEEIVALAVPHLEQAPCAIVSFGQGCEGEPLLRARLIGRALQSIRQQTSRGQLHINTNGSNPRALQYLIDSGLDSVRVSMFSARDRNHVAYYGPRNYSLDDMSDGLQLARRQGLHTSINLLTYPGFTDCPSEVEELIAFFHRSGVQMVQIRTLNMDRELLHEKVGFPPERGIGVRAAMERFVAEIQGLTLASHTPFVGRAHAYVS